MKFLLSAVLMSMAGIAVLSSTANAESQMQVAVGTPFGEVRCTPKVEVSYRCELVRSEVHPTETQVAIIDDEFGCGCIRRRWCGSLPV